MTKKQLQEIAKEEAQKTALKWRLSSKPTLKDVEKMLELEIISKDEARDMLFSEETKDDKVKALEEQIQFLRELTDKLASQPPQLVYKYIHDYIPRYTWGGITLANSPTMLVGSSTAGKIHAYATNSGSISSTSGNTMLGMNTAKATVAL